jgi:hypothetical protein
MRYAFLGALLTVAGIAGQIVAGRNHPVDAIYAPTIVNGSSPASGWSHTAYDLIRIGAWGLIVFGAVIVAFALVREARRSV